MLLKSCFARFGVRFANHRLYASSVAAIVYRHQSTSSVLSVDEIVEKLARENINSPAGSRLSTPQLNLNKSIHEIADIFNNVQTSTTPLDADDLQNSVDAIQSRMSEINKVDQLIQLLQSLPNGHVKHREIFAPIADQIRNSINSMSSDQTIAIFSQLRLLFWRDEDLLTAMSEHLIRLRQELAPKKLESLGAAMRGLTFSHPRLVKYMVEQFVKIARDADDWAFVSFLTGSFSLLKINNPTFWTAVCEWLNRNLETSTSNINHMRYIVNSCSIVNVPGSLIEKQIKMVVDYMQSNPKVRATAPIYLNIAYALAIFKALPSYEANKILQPEFFREMQDHCHRKFSTSDDSANMMILRSAVRILQIAASYKYDALSNPKLPDNLMNYVKKSKDLPIHSAIQILQVAVNHRDDLLKPKTSTEVIDFVNEKKHLMQQMRYGKKQLVVIEEFRQNLYLSAPLKTHSMAPDLYIPTGTYLDALLWVCPKRKVILPLKEGPKSQGAEQVGVIFATKNLLTEIDAGSDSHKGLPLVRPIGDLKMSFRHLQAAGIRPAVIDYYSYTNIPENARKIKYIKEAILKPSENLNKDWH
ncbi:hypothetical protein M3Y97_00760300 [Aphelenchoides bicaudatus]|nr:hypothetical protein M3Y97_00760300 [Aphelenchoides bicaudatus]